MKKGLINAIILALVVVNLVLSVIMVFVFVPAINKTSNLVDKICTIVDLDIGEESKDHKVDITQLANVTVKFGEETESTVSLLPGADGKAHYIRVSIVLGLDTTHEDYDAKAGSVDTAMGIIASSVIDVIGGYSYEDIDKAKMEQEVLKKLQDLFDSEFIYSVKFNQFTIQ